MNNQANLPMKFVNPNFSPKLLESASGCDNQRHLHWLYCLRYGPQPGPNRPPGIWVTFQLSDCLNLAIYIYITYVYITYIYITCI